MSRPAYVQVCLHEQPCSVVLDMHFSPGAMVDALTLGLIVMLVPSATVAGISAVVVYGMLMFGATGIPVVVYTIVAVAAGSVEAPAPVMPVDKAFDVLVGGSQVVVKEALVPAMLVNCIA
mmetsp:Transcript_48229/g.112869  ORF Transcript_48229/g.112869 Transcript_48229/m.112869 type:complete len:120 (+) Transcript_48229:300-659(+)